MQTITRNLIIKHTFMFVLFSTAIILAGCRGDEGPMGPRGQDGNANVSSVQYNVPPENWSGDFDGYTAILNVPEITADIYNNGAVLVYRMIDENSSFNMLPYTAVDTTSITNLDFDVFVGEIDLFLRYTDNGINDTSRPTVNFAFKVVIIEGIPLAALKKQVNTADYRAVSNYLKLDKVPVIVKK